MMNIIFAHMDFALAALNVYLWLSGGRHAAFSLAVAVFCFGCGICQIVMHTKGR
jgi:hypothetical protein